MFRQDYIIRMIEQVAKALLNIREKRKSNQLIESNQDVSFQLKSFIGMDLHFVLTFQNDHLFSIIKSNTIDKQFGIFVFLIEGAINFKQLDQNLKFEKVISLANSIWEIIKEDIPIDKKEEFRTCCYNQTPFH